MSCQGGEQDRESFLGKGRPEETLRGGSGIRLVGGRQEGEDPGQVEVEGGGGVEAEDHSSDVGPRSDGTRPTCGR